jgi:hypothetical protein
LAEITPDRTDEIEKNRIKSEKEMQKPNSEDRERGDDMR